MGSWSEQQEVKKEVKEKDKVRREKLAGLFFDLAKLSFAGLVVGGGFLVWLNTKSGKKWLANL